MEKDSKVFYNYQVVFKFNDNDRMIFAGVTSDSLEDLLSQCDTRIGLPFGAPPIESVIYQPVKTEEK